MCKKGEIAACILYVTNSISFVLAIAGLAIGIWLLTADTGVTNSFPDYLSVAIVISMSVILLLGGLGIFATVAQMKENKDHNANTGKALGKEGCCTKDCCNSCGISLYGFFAIAGSLLALALGVVALYYSGALPAEVTALYDNTTASDTVNGWFASLDTYIDSSIYGAISASVGGTDWIATQNLLGCCGWNDTQADPTIYLTGECCPGQVGTNATLVDSLSSDTIEDLFITGDISITISQCNTVNGSPMTCKGIMLYTTQSNLTTVGVVLCIMFFVLFVCFICALKVRYCAGGQAGDASVAPADGQKNAKVDIRNKKNEDEKAMRLQSVKSVGSVL